MGELGQSTDDPLPPRPRPALAPDPHPLAPRRVAHVRKRLTRHVLACLGSLLAELSRTSHDCRVDLSVRLFFLTGALIND